MRLPLILLTFFSCLITACGFQLRGLNHSLSEQFSQIYMEQASVSQPFQKKVKELIVASGGALTDKNMATTAIYLAPIQTSSRQVSLSASGSVKEYERIYSTKVTIINLKDQSQIGSRSISNTQYLQLDELSPQAGEEQSRISLRAAEDDLAQAIMSYLSTFK